MKIQDNTNALNEIFSKLFTSENRYAFLIGAGVSMAPPTNLSSARQIVNDIFEVFAPSEEIPSLLNLKGVRYEQIIENLQSAFDPELKIMDYFDLVRNPNLIHYFLARMVLNKEAVITTNFDYLIEHALIDLLPKEKRSEIKLIISKDDYQEFNKNKLNSSKLDLIVKLHGSKKNIITNESTKSSLIATMSALGKNRESGQTFAIESFKKPTIYHLLDDRTLIVLGYSGNDDFDIGPTLREFHGLKNLIWIDHASDNNTKVDIFSGQQFEQESYSHLDILLNEIALRNKIKVHKIVTNTMGFIKEILGPKLIQKEMIVNTCQEKDAILVPTYKIWMNATFPDVDLIKKYIFASKIYSDVGEFKPLKRIAERGISLLEDTNPTLDLAPFYDFLSLYYYRSGDFQKAIFYAEKELRIEEEFGKGENKAVVLNNLAGCYLNLGNYQKGLDLYEEALRIHEKNKNLEPMAAIINNIAAVFTIQGKFKEALLNNEKALQINEKIGSLSGKAKCTNDIGWVYHMQGNFKEASEKYLQALRIEKEIGNLWGISARLVDVGNINKSMGQIDEALIAYNKALTIQEKINDLSSKAAIFNNIGAIHTSKGNLEEAFKWINEALEIREKLGDIRGKSNTLVSLGEVLIKQGKNKDAKEQFTTARKIFEDIGDPSGLATCVHKLGISEYLLGDVIQAKSLLLESIKLFEKIGNLNGVNKTKQVIKQLNL